jgi:V8-like Glu-specific endopeptidase
MAVLKHYNPLIHDIYHYPTPATQTSGGIAPDGYSADCQTYGVIDWSGTRALQRYFCRMLPSTPYLTIPHDPTSVNFWNQCTYGAVLISPRHALICQHFRGAHSDPTINTGGIRFLGKGGAWYENTVTRVYLNVGPDLTLLEFLQPFPDADLKIYHRIADPQYIPAGTNLWTKDSNGKVYKTVYMYANYNGTDTTGYNFRPSLDGVNDGAYQNGTIAIFVGDSGSPVMVRDSYGETVFVGLQYGGQSINRQTFARLRDILTPFNYPLEHVKLSAKPEDINQDGKVDAEDLARVLANWGQTKDPFSDMDGDGRVDGIDISILMSAWGSYTIPTNTQTPSIPTLPPPPDENNSKPRN